MIGRRGKPRLGVHFLGRLSTEMVLNWQGTATLKLFKFQCGYCQQFVASERGFNASITPNAQESRAGAKAISHQAYVCPNCFGVTTVLDGVVVGPHPAYGQPIDHLPGDIAKVWQECRNCMQASAFTGAVLLCRALITHIAVEKGAKARCTFAEGLKHLQDGQWLPKDSDEWVDRIRSEGNKGNHERVVFDKPAAEDVMDFTDMLLRLTYNFQHRAKKGTP